jgi:hypothetical protein
LLCEVSLKERFQICSSKVALLCRETWLQVVLRLWHDCQVSIDVSLHSTKRSTRLQMLLLIVCMVDGDGEVAARRMGG